MTQGHDDSGSPACPLVCDDGEGAFFELSCAPTDLVSVTVTGPCATGDAGSTTYGDRFYTSSWVWVTGSGPGVCNVELAFASGFAYAVSVTFTVQSGDGPPGCPGCPPYVAPTQRKFTVENPSTTCLDGGPDAGSADSTPPDAASWHPSLRRFGRTATARSVRGRMERADDSRIARCDDEGAVCP